MTLTDAGPLIALIDSGEPDHDRCRQALEQLEFPLITTWPAFTDAIYLLASAAGWPGHHALWQMTRRDALTIADLDLTLANRSTELWSATATTRWPSPMPRSWPLPRLAISTLDKRFRSYRPRT